MNLVPATRIGALEYILTFNHWISPIMYVYIIMPALQLRNWDLKKSINLPKI